MGSYANYDGMLRCTRPDNVSIVGCKYSSEARGDLTCLHLRRDFLGKGNHVCASELALRDALLLEETEDVFP